MNTDRPFLAAPGLAFEPAGRDLLETLPVYRLPNFTGGAAPNVLFPIVERPCPDHSLYLHTHRTC